MARPSRNTSRDHIQDGPRTFFVTSRTIEGRSLLQTERMANLFIDVLRTYVAAKKFRLHDFVAMPNHFHLQLTLDGRKTIEKAVGLVKGNFSYRAKKELGYQFEIWQPGFSDERCHTSVRARLQPCQKAQKKFLPYAVGRRAA